VIGPKCQPPDTGGITATSSVSVIVREGSASSPFTQMRDLDKTSANDAG